MWVYLFFVVSLKYLFPFILYLSGGKTYQPALVVSESIIKTRLLSLIFAKTNIRT